MRSLVLVALIFILSMACSEPPLPAGTRGDHESTLATSLRGAFFVVHIETSDHSVFPDSVETEWPMLVEMVAAFEARGHRLTLEFQPQWAEYALAHPEALEQVRRWEANGHEIALHHHGLSHPAWDGFTNDRSKARSTRYRGDMAFALSLVSQLSSTGRIKTAGMTDEGTDWPAGVVYATGGLGMSGEAVVSTPNPATYNGQAVTQVSHRAYSLTHQNGPSVSLEEIQHAIESARTGQVLGLVTHPFDFAANRDAFDALFDLIALYDIKFEPVSALLSPVN